MPLKTSIRALLVTCLLVDIHRPPPPAEACGVKLTVKPTAPRRAVARSSNPSPVLLVGSPPRRLQNDLTLAGHKVDVAQDPQAAKRTRYAVVIVDKPHESAARERFGDSVVIVRSGNVRKDIVAVEGRVAREPVAVASARPAVAAKPAREPIAAGPPREAPKEVVTAKQPEPVAVAPEPTPPAPTPAPPEPEPAPPTRVATSVPAKPETPRKPVVDQAALREEVFFGVNSADVRQSRGLARAIKWLTNNASVSVVVSGHADPTGTPEGNLALSQTRAEAVRDFLVEKGIDASRIEVKALGDTQLKYGRRDGRNRRVAIDASK